MVNNNSSGVMGTATAGRISMYAAASDTDIRKKEWNVIVDKLESFETFWELYAGLGTMDFQRIADIGKPVKAFLEKHYPNHGAAVDLLDHYTVSVVMKAQIGSPAASIVGVGKEVFDWAATKLGNKFSGFSLDDLSADFAGFAGYSPVEAAAAGLLSHTDSNVDWTGVQGNWGSNIKKIIEMMDPDSSQSEPDKIEASFAYKEMFDIDPNTWGDELFLPPDASDSQSGRSDRGHDPDSIHAYAMFDCGGWGLDDSMAELNAEAENVTCRLSTILGNPLGKQEGWIYHGKKTVTITPESLGWNTEWQSDSENQLGIEYFQTFAGNVLSYNTNDGVPYAPHVTKNQGHDLFQPYNATSYTIEADHYSHWHWVLKTDVNGKYVMESKITHTGPKTLCDGTVLAGETSHPGHEGHSTHPAEFFDEWNHAWVKWTDDLYYNAVVTGIGHDDVIKLQQDDSDFIPEPPMPPESPIPEPPITITEYGDTIPLTKRPKSSSGRRVKVVDDYEVVTCNGDIVPKSEFILTEHNRLYVLRPPECEITVNVTWKDPEPLANPDAIAPPEFDPSIMATILPSSLHPFHNYEEFIRFKKEIAGSYYEGFDLMGDSPAGMTEWTAALQAQADLEWNDLLNMMSGYEDDFTNYTYTPGAGDLIYDEPHKIWTTKSAADAWSADHFGNYTNDAGVVEDWSGIPTNTNLPSTIRNVSSVTTGVVDGLYTYHKVTFEHDCPACAEDITTYPSNTWLKYEVYYNGVSL
jgi:hypothetical protein